MRQMQAKHSLCAPGPLAVLENSFAQGRLALAVTQDGTSAIVKYLRPSRGRESMEIYSGSPLELDSTNYYWWILNTFLSRRWHEWCETGLLEECVTPPAPRPGQKSRLTFLLNANHPTCVWSETDSIHSKARSCTIVYPVTMSLGQKTFKKLSKSLT